jgi:hypothetical protein
MYKYLPKQKFYLNIDQLKDRNSNEENKSLNLVEFERKMGLYVPNKEHLDEYVKLPPLAAIGPAVSGRLPDEGYRKRANLFLQKFKIVLEIFVFRICKTDTFSQIHFAGFSFLMQKVRHQTNSRSQSQALKFSRKIFYPINLLLKARDSCQGETIFQALDRM